MHEGGDLPLALLECFLEDFLLVPHLLQVELHPLPLKLQLLRLLLPLVELFPQLPNGLLLVPDLIPMLRIDPVHLFPDLGDLRV